MWITKLALRRPYTFIVVALSMLVFGIWHSMRIPKDIFPNINTPVVSVVWSYTGMTAKQFEQRITSFSEFSLSSTVNGIERIESQTLNGMALIRIYFYPDVEIQAAMAQVTATSQEILRRLPEGITPPVILLYSPSSVPITQVVVSSETVAEQDLYDYASYRLRHLIATIQGLTLPTPFGGKVRELMIDTNPEALQARGLSPRDIRDAINNQNVIIPTGDAKIGPIDYVVNANNTPNLPEEYNHIPIAVKDGSIVYLNDVAFAHEGFPPQINVVRDEGHRAVLLSIIKNGTTSILEIIQKVKDMLPSLRESAPKGINIELRFDQSVYVKQAIENVVKESILAIVLTGILILLFLGNWINTAIVLVSIPLSLLTSIILISWMGHSLNIMTLGGLALATGILVDNAVITLENINRNLSLGKSLRRAVLDGSYQIALPSFVSSLCICIVFLPITLLTGSAKLLFIPFSYAAIFAISASYILSRTLVPLMILYLIKENTPLSKRGFEKGFEKFREGYSIILSWSLKNRKTICLSFAIVFCSTFLLLPFIGRDFFPTSNSDQLRLHVRAATGTRIEVTEQIFGDIEEEIRKIIPFEDLDVIDDNIGVPPVAYNLAFGDNATVGTWDGEILVSLRSSKKQSSSYYMKKLRNQLHERFPTYTFYFQPADLIGQILNFGLPTPIDVRVIGYDAGNNLEIARELVHRISQVPGVVDVHLHQDVNAPELFLNVNRILLSQIGLMQKNVTNDMLITNSDSTITTPNYWLDTKMGLPYLIAVQTPKYRVDSIEALMSTPIASPLTRRSELLSNIATIERRHTPAVINHFNIQPVYDIYANIQDSDLGSVASKIQKIIAEFRPKMAPGNEIHLMGKVRDMNIAFVKLGIGLIAAIILVYFILVINFQSWLDALVIMFALPGAITGVVWALYLTQTPFCIPSMFGAIVSIGVAIANSILVVTFGNHQLLEGKTSIEAIHFSGITRLRPVLITALAMIVGMIPMALGLGSGSAEHAPLARAVIGGLILATMTTLFFVPVMFSYLRKKPNPHLSLEKEEQKI